MWSVSHPRGAILVNHVNVAVLWEAKLKIVYYYYIYNIFTITWRIISSSVLIGQEIIHTMKLYYKQHLDADFF